MNNDGTVKEELGGMGDRISGAAKDAVGSVTGNERLEREGEAQNAYGNARQENNDILGFKIQEEYYQTKLFKII